jgi:hypothetical protein
MPTVLWVRGWRLFFYADEGTEPPHVHARKGGAECKFWLRREVYDIEEEWAHGLTVQLRREIRRIILQNLDLLLEEWDRFFAES